MADTLLSPGSAATVRVPPRRGLAHLVGRPCAVVSVRDETVGGRLTRFATVHVDDGSAEGIQVPDVPAGFLSPATPLKRRSPLNLKAPKDGRSEAERMDDGLALLAGWGYEHLRVGQGRAAAICHKCSRQQRRMVKIRCKECDSLGFSPSTNSTEGTPDSYVWHPASYPPLLMCPLEWKDGPRGERRPAQAALEAAGRIAVVWDEKSCLEAVYAFERADPRIMPNPQVLDWLTSHGAVGSEEVAS